MSQCMRFAAGVTYFKSLCLAVCKCHAPTYNNGHSSQGITDLRLTTCISINNFQTVAPYASS